MTRLMGAPVAILASALAACAPPLGLQRARVLAPSASQLAGGLELGLVTPDLGPENNAKIPWLNLSAGYRRGIADGVEVGGRVMMVGVRGFTSLGVAGDVKLQLLASGDPGRGTDMATGAVLAYQQIRLGGTPWHLSSIAFPLLIGHNLGRHQFVWGPRLAYELWTGEGQDPIHLFYAGASAAFAWRVGDSLELVPELAILYSPMKFGGEVDAGDRTGATITQLTLGASWHF